MHASGSPNSGSTGERIYRGEIGGVDYRGLPDATPAKGEIDENFAKAIGPDYWEKRRGTFDARLAADRQPVDLPSVELDQPRPELLAAHRMSPARNADGASLLASGVDDVADIAGGDGPDDAVDQRRVEA